MFKIRMANGTPFDPNDRQMTSKWQANDNAGQHLGPLEGRW